jgi:hypothetical protein
MPIDTNKPLLQLSVGQPQIKPTGRRKNPPKPKHYSVDYQREVFGPKFDHLAAVLNRDQGGIELRSDPSALAPERLLVFEVRGSIQSFINAVRKVQGLEFIDEEELDKDDQDNSPAVYLLVPDERALREIVPLWGQWSNGEALRTEFTPWRDVFATLRNIRPWGPNDRVQAGERQVISTEIAFMADDERIRLEIELVFRLLDQGSWRQRSKQLPNSGHWLSRDIS